MSETLPDLPTLRDLVRSAEPEIVVNTREDLIGYAEAARARRDVIAMRDGLRASRVVEWEMAHRWPAKPTTGPRRDDDRPALTSADVKADREGWQRIYAVGRADIDDILARDRIEDLSQRAFRMAVHVGHNTGVPDWYTPGDIIEAARATLGAIDLDPASSDIANVTVCAERYYTVDDDGLAQPWKGRVWLNPPYSAAVVDRFVDRLVDHYESGDVTAAAVLTNNATDASWWQRLFAVAAAVCFPAGRVRFLDPQGRRPGAPLQGQTIAYLGDNAERFEQEFCRFGETARKACHQRAYRQRKAGR